MKIKPIEEIKSFCQSEIDKTLNGVTVYDVTFKGGDYPTLTIVIDKKGGVDLDLCEKVSNILNEPLDTLDPTFNEPYSLNVSSKGIDWAFKTDEDFISHLNQKIEVKLKTAVKGKKFYDGILTNYDKKAICVKIDEKTTLTFDLKNTAKVNEYVDF